MGIITAFNFPVAVYAWNTSLALVAGDTVVWKPAEGTRLAAIAVNELLSQAVKDSGAPADIHRLVLADRVAGQRLVENEKVALISATGSVAMGRAIAPLIARRFGRALLELGGNNAAIVAPSADLDLALRGVVFAAAGTAGQRCTWCRVEPFGGGTRLHWERQLGKRLISGELVVTSFVPERLLVADVPAGPVRFQSVISLAPTQHGIGAAVRAELTQQPHGLLCLLAVPMAGALRKRATCRRSRIWSSAKPEPLPARQAGPPPIQSGSESP